LRKILKLDRLGDYTDFTRIPKVPAFTLGTLLAIIFLGGLEICGFARNFWATVSPERQAIMPICLIRGGKKRLSGFANEAKK